MNKKEAKIINIILLVTAIIDAILLTRAIIIGSKAIVDSVLVAVLLLVAYKYKANSNLNTATVSGAAIFFVLHLFGAHGLYDYYIFDSIGYDKLLHFYGPFVLFVVVFNYLDFKKTKLTLKNIIIFAALITLGINAIQEVLEFTGNSLLGKGEGVFFYGSGDLGGDDTPKDLIANFLGVTLSGIVMYFGKRK